MDEHYQSQTVTRWKKALGIGPTTEGTSRLHRDHADDPAVVEGLVKAHGKATDPARRAKIAAAKKGKRRPASVVDAMRKGRTGKPQSEAARAKMREAARKRREKKTMQPTGRPLAHIDLADGSERPVFQDDDGRQYILDDDDLPVFGVWFVAGEDCDQPVIVRSGNDGFPF